MCVQNEILTQLADGFDNRGFLVTKLHDSNLQCIGCRRFLDRFCIGQSCLFCFKAEIERIDSMDDVDE